jgi:hypothetical protein
MNEADAETVEVPARLYAQARRCLLENEPLRDQSSSSRSVAAALTAGEATALDAVGLSTQSWDGDAEEDPLMHSITEYLALIETSFTLAEVAELLQVDVNRIRQRLRDGSLFGVDDDGERRLPRFQFERHHVLPGIREVLAALPPALNPLDVAQWFMLPNADLRLRDGTPVGPREWLLRGESVDAVVALARSFE